MNFAICPLSVVPIRNSSNDRSEQLSQLLFGDTVEVLEEKGKQWSKIRCSWDNLVGWVHTNQLQAITPDEFDLFQENFAYNLELLYPLMNDQYSIPIPFGARLPNFDGMRFQLADKTFNFSGQAVFPSDIKSNAEMVLKMARRLLYAPFQAGGRSPLGIDADGFVQIAFQIVGIDLYREASMQLEQGEAIDFVEQAKAGDLAFFENSKGKINHVGILLGKDQIIHVSGRVKVDAIDHYGIYDLETKKYSHKLRVIRRVLADQDIPEAKEEMDATNQANQFLLFS